MAITTPAITNSTGTRAVINQSNTTSSSGTDTAQEKADKLQNQFMSILLTQLQNQNPLDPMDTKEFTGQLAQFSALEQQISTNTKLDALVASIQSNTTTSAFTYLGKEADIDSAMTSYQSGEADWTYDLAKDAQKVTIKVVDSTGKTVFTQTDSNVDAGSYAFSLKASDFNPVPADGSVLTLKIDAADANDKAVASTIHTTVMIDGIESGENGVDMRAGNLLFGMTDIKKVRTPQPTSSIPA